MQKVISILFVFLVICCSCNNGKQLSADEYVRYFEKSKEENKIITDRIDYQLQLVTPECIAAREVLQEKKQFNAAAYNERLKAIAGNTYVFVRVYDKARGNTSKDQQVLYYQQYAQQQMKLVADGATVKMPEYVNYEDSYGLAPYNTIIVCFNYDLKSTQKDLQFVYNDVLTGNSNIQMNYTAGELKALPQIKI